VAGRPLAGVIPGHDQRGPIALYNAKVWKNQKANFAILGKCKSRKSKNREIAKVEIRESAKSNAKVRRCETFAFA
jgi:hypothetical protein